MLSIIKPDIESMAEVPHADLFAQRIANSAAAYVADDPFESTQDCDKPSIKIAKVGGATDAFSVLKSAVTCANWVRVSGSPDDKAGGGRAEGA